MISTQSDQTGGFSWTTRTNSPTPIAVICAGLFLLAIGVGWFFGSWSELVCDRRDGRCELWNRGEQIRTLPLSELQSAELRTSRSRNGSTYSTVLVGSFGELAITQVATSDKLAHRRQVERINAFVQEGRGEELRVAFDSRPFAWTFAAGLIAFTGLIWFLAAGRWQGRVDRASGAIELRPGNPLQKRQRLLRDEVVGISVETELDARQRRVEEAREELRRRAPGRELPAAIASGPGPQNATTLSRVVFQTRVGAVVPATGWLLPADDVAGLAEQLRVNVLGGVPGAVPATRAS